MSTTSTITNCSSDVINVFDLASGEWLGLNIQPNGGTLSISTCQTIGNTAGFPTLPVAVYGGTNINEDPLVFAFNMGNTPTSCLVPPYPSNIFFGDTGLPDPVSFTSCPGATGTTSAFTLFNGDTQTATAIASETVPPLGQTLVGGQNGNITLATNIPPNGNVTIDPCIAFNLNNISLVGNTDGSIIGTTPPILGFPDQNSCENPPFTGNIYFSHGQTCVVFGQGTSDPIGCTTFIETGIKIVVTPNTFSPSDEEALIIVWTSTASLPPTNTTLESLIPQNPAWSSQQYSINTVPFWLNTQTVGENPTIILVYEAANVPYSSSYVVTTNTIYNAFSSLASHNDVDVYISSVVDSVLTIGPAPPGPICSDSIPCPNPGDICQNGFCVPPTKTSYLYIVFIIIGVVIFLIIIGLIIFLANRNKS